MTAKEPKYCELCGGNFFRVIGSKNKYCIKCHANWDKALIAASSVKGHEHALKQADRYNFSE